MKKFFTLLCAAFATSAAFAQTTLIDFPSSKDGVAISGTSTEGTVKIHTNTDAVACFTLKNGYTTAEGAYNENSINLTTAGGFKAGDVITIAGAINNADEAKRATAVLFTLDGTTPTTLNKFSDFINGRLVADEPVEESYTLEADASALYLGRDGGTGANLVKIQVVRPAGSGEGQGGESGNEPETYTAISWNGTEYTVAPEFAAVVADPATGGAATNINADGVSIINFGTANMEAVAVGGTTAKTCDATSVTEWNDIKWDWKNQGDIKYAYINGTGNPVFGYDIEEVMTDGTPTGNYRQNFDNYYYEPECGKLPAQGLYYKFTAKIDGEVKLNIWANKGNRNTYLVDEATTKPVAYSFEGYVNGQNEVIGQDPETGNDISAKKWLSTEEIQYLHDNAKCQKDADGNIIPGTDSAPYVIGAGNQPFWGQVIYSMKAGQTVYLFHHNAQIGFQGYTFTPNSSDAAINNVAAESKSAAIFNLRGQRVNSVVRGQIFIQNGQKVIIR